MYTCESSAIGVFMPINIGTGPDGFEVRQNCLLHEFCKSLVIKVKIILCKFFQNLLKFSLIFTKFFSNFSNIFNLSLPNFFKVIKIFAY